LNSLINEASE